MTDTQAPPLSEPFDLAGLGDASRTIGITANAMQCAALADQFGLPAITALSGTFKLARSRSGPVTAQLDLVADITQTCVVSLEPFDQHIAERTPLLLYTAAQAAKLDPHAPIDPDAPDEIIADDTFVDLGAILGEQLALALDPYPRKPDAVIPVDAAPARVSPFAALGRRFEEEE